MSTSSEISAWTGWAAFVGAMMLIIGTFQAILGFVALFQHTYFRVDDTDLVVSVSYTAWGWLHILVGAFVALAGGAVLTGATWGRVVGVLVASISILVNFAFMPAYPLWSVVIITIDVLAIYALIVHGGELSKI